MTLGNRRITIREVADDIGIPFGMKRAAGKIVPKLLNFEQKQRRMDIAKDMLTTLNNESFQMFLHI